MFFFYKYFNKKFSTEPREDGLEYAGNSARYISILCDLLAIIFICSKLNFLISFFPHNWFFIPVELSNKMQFGLNLNPEEEIIIANFKTKYFILQISQLFIAGFYLLIPWYYLGGSLSCMLLGLRITNENGGNLSWKQVIIRLLALIPTLLTFMLGLFYGFFDKKRQTLYDKIARTIMVTKSSLQKTGKYHPRYDPIDKYLMPLIDKYLLPKVKNIIDKFKARFPKK